MKKRILGLDLGTTSIGWAVVDEAEIDVDAEGVAIESEESEVLRLGVRRIALTTDEQTDFEKGKPITTCAARTQKRGARRSLQRYRLRREHLLRLLTNEGWITPQTALCEHGAATTFQTLRLRAKAATEQVGLEELARVLLMLNKKRGYKSNRKANKADGEAIDGMEVARVLHDEQLTPGQYLLKQLDEHGQRRKVSFYLSDLNDELARFWQQQSLYYPEVFSPHSFAAVGSVSSGKLHGYFHEAHHIDAREFNTRQDDDYRALCVLRVQGLTQRLELADAAGVAVMLLQATRREGGLLGQIGERSKTLFFSGKTIGQRLVESIERNPNASLRNQPFYRKDYIDEFERIWAVQQQYYPQQLTPRLHALLRDCIIYYQRPLKSKKGLLAYCELESREIEVPTSEGHTKRVRTGSRICPRSMPLYQEFRIRQVLNNIVADNAPEVPSDTFYSLDCAVGELTSQAPAEALEMLAGQQASRRLPRGRRWLSEEEKEKLYTALTYHEKLKGTSAVKLLWGGKTSATINYADLEGNRTMARLYKVWCDILEDCGSTPIKLASDNLDTLHVQLQQIEQQFAALGYDTRLLRYQQCPTTQEFCQTPLFALWHLLYSYEGDNTTTGCGKLVQHLMERYGFSEEHAKMLASVSFEDDYGSLSSKAIGRLLPFLREGNGYADACVLAGYGTHSRFSLTKEQNENRQLDAYLPQLAYGSLRNPVVEKILNQMAHVVNGLIDAYGPFDEIRVEMARELKKNNAERAMMKQAISTNTKNTERITEILKSRFDIPNPSRNDVLHYRLWEELAANEYRTFYSNKPIPEEKIFSKDIDIEHIIPQSVMFDDSFANKTLEYRDVNIEKGNDTALDFVQRKYSNEGVERYRAAVEKMQKNHAISDAKAKKLLMKRADIPCDFIDRDLRNTQYIARKAMEMLRRVCRTVTATTGSVTDRLRSDWQLIDVMKELNYDKYAAQGLVHTEEHSNGNTVTRIDNWTKRNDNRHHAMDALTIAFTRPAYIQYLNNLSSHFDATAESYSLGRRYLRRGADGHSVFIPPMPLGKLRAVARQKLDEVLISIKSKTKVVTPSLNTTQAKGRKNQKVQLTPRGQLHMETVYSRRMRPVTKEVKVGGTLTAELIAQVCSPKLRQLLMERLDQFGGDPKKAFTGRNSLEKNPIYIDKLLDIRVPERVKIMQMEEYFTIRKPVTPDLDISKVVDDGVRRVLQQRLDQCGGDKKKAFGNLDANPIYLNRAAGITIKSVKIKAHVSEAEPLHTKHDHFGQPLFGAEGGAVPTDYVQLCNNHHVAIFADSEGVLREHVVSFMEATTRAVQGLPIVDTAYNAELGWSFRFIMKSDEYFVFPGADGFNPEEVDLLDPKNYAAISPNLFRVQKLADGDYWFRHHLDTTTDNPKELRDITWKRIQTTDYLKGAVKVRVDHIGRIVEANIR